MLAILCNPDDRWVIDTIKRDKIKIVAFSDAFDKWRDDATGVETEVSLADSLPGNTDKGAKTIRLNERLASQRAAITSFHELSHWKRPSPVTRALPALAAILCALACSTSRTLPRDKPVGGDMLEVTAEVRTFVPQAMHDNSGPNGFAVYDATELVVIEPADRRGAALRIFHDAELPADSPWRRVGQRLRMRLPRTMLEPGNQIFAGAVQDLRPL